MGIKIIKKGGMVEDVSYSVDFDKGEGCGASFDCDKDGNLDFSKMHPCAVEHYDECVAAGFPRSIGRWVNRYYDAPVGICYCGKKVYLSNPMDNSCSCGRCYNGSGQEVEPNYGRAECVRDGWAYDENDY